jgi:hypothetical protein
MILKNRRQEDRRLVLKNRYNRKEDKEGRLKDRKKHRQKRGEESKLELQEHKNRQC